MPLFDASIDLTFVGCSAGGATAQAVEAVRAAVERMPGAGWISVEYHATAAGPPIVVRIYDAGEISMDNTARARLARLVQITARNAMFPSLTLTVV